MQRLTPQDNEVNRKVQVNAVVVMADEHVINQAISKQPCLKINPLVLPQGAVQYDQAVFFFSSAAHYANTPFHFTTHCTC